MPALSLIRSVARRSEGPAEGTVKLLVEPNGRSDGSSSAFDAGGSHTPPDTAVDPAERTAILGRVLAGDIDDREGCRRLGATPIELTRWKLRALEAIEAGDPLAVRDQAPTSAPAPSLPVTRTAPFQVPQLRLIAAAAVGVLAFAVSLVLALPGNVSALEVLGPLARWVMYAATLLCAGGVLFLWWVHDGRAEDREKGALERIVRTSVIVGVAATVIELAVHGATLTGTGALGVLDPRNLAEAATGAVAGSVLLRLGGLGYIAYAIRRFSHPSTRIVAIVGAALALGSFLLVGHTTSSEPRAVVLTADLLHATAGAGWFGGLVLLSVSMHHRHITGDVAGATRIVHRFSRFALASVALLVVAGTALAVIELPGIAALFTSPYGSMILAKSVLVAVVLTVAARNHRTLVPAMVVDGDEGAWGRLRRTVVIELGGLVLVLLATALLVALSPPA